ncbi:hypothetical protein SLS56_012261 [Neofusicoccum ribis]|uniref:Uncharacterized protein n=1 Tax=Neofusicoccum ribis TaxID=45134 RepID=A0ABR3S9B5_9PEZI
MPSGLELYLQDPPTAFSDDSEFYAYHNVTLDIFQARLALILNTFYDASLNTSNFFGADGVALYDVESHDELQYGNATGTWTEFTPSRYVVQYAWLSLYLASTTVLAICAVVTVIRLGFDD